MMLLMLMLFLSRAEQSFRKSKHRATLVSAFSCRPLCLCCLSASVGDPIRFSSQRGMDMGYKQHMKIPTTLLVGSTPSRIDQRQSTLVIW